MSSWQARARFLVEEGKLVEAAELLAKSGSVKAAADVFARAGEFSRAANCLVKLQDFRSAGELFLKSVPGGRLRNVASMRAQERRAVLNAATCFGRCGELDRAVRLFMAIDEPQRAAELLRRAGRQSEADELSQSGAGSRERGGGQAAAAEAARRLEEAGNLPAAISAYERLGHHAEAGRVAATAGAWSEASRLFMKAGDGVRAGECYLQLGEKLDAVKAWCRVPRSDSRYAAVVSRAVQVASEISHLDFELDHFVAPFIKSVAQRKDPRELPVLLALSRLYEQHGFEESAQEALQAMLVLEPEHPEASSRLQTLSGREQGSSMVYQKILDEDLSFQGRERPTRRRGAALQDAPLDGEGLPDLPDLPSRPGLPALRPEDSQPSATSMRAARTPTQQAPSDYDPGGARGGTRQGMSSPPPPPAPAPIAAAPPSAAPGTSGVVFAEGATIADRYILDSCVGSGGMASVFKAKDEVLDEICALKVFKQVVDDPDAVARFKRELKLSRKLVHPHILRVYDYGMWGGANYMTMELLEGEELAERIDRRLEVISLQEVLLWLGQTAAGLSEAHSQGVVHRDIKPQNLFLIHGGTHLKVMDFGVARVSSAPKISRTGMIVGTPEYMAPEQISGAAELGPPTDIYALGIVAYELLTRDVPFSAAELMPLLMKHLTEIPAAPSTLAPQIPAELDALVVRMLSKDPAERPVDCIALGQELEAIAQIYGATEIGF